MKIQKLVCWIAASCTATEMSAMTSVYRKLFLLPLEARKPPAKAPMVAAMGRTVMIQMSCEHWLSLSGAQLEGLVSSQPKMEIIFFAEVLITDIW